MPQGQPQDASTSPENCGENNSLTQGNSLSLLCHLMRGKRYYTTQLIEGKSLLQEAPKSMGDYLLIGIQSSPPMFFDILELTANQYLGWNDLSKFCEDIGVSTVPLISYGYRFDLTPDVVKTVSENMNETLGKVVAGMVYRTVEPEWILNHRLELVVRNARY